MNFDVELVLVIMRPWYKTVCRVMHVRYCHDKPFNLKLGWLDMKSVLEPIVSVLHHLYELLARQHI